MRALLARGRRGGVAAGGHAGRRRACVADGYQLSEIQAQQILEMRLHRLTGLEQEKLTDEYKELLDDDRAA